MSYSVPYRFFDAPIIIDCSVTPIPASSSPPLQVIADSTFHTGVGIQYHDTTNKFIGVFLGSAGFETLLCVIGNGISAQMWGAIPSHSRVSLRNIENQQITQGKLLGVLITI